MGLTKGEDVKGMLWETPIKNTSLNALRHPAIHPFSTAYPINHYWVTVY